MKKALRRLWAHMRKHAALWIGLGAFFLLAWRVTGTSCTFQSTIGLPCPGCGLTRALLASLHGRFQEAFSLHPLFWLAPLVILAVLILLAVAPDRLSDPKLNRFWLGLAILFMVVYLVRMVFYFPDREPLTWNDQAVLPRLWRLVRDGFRLIFG